VQFHAAQAFDEHHPANNWAPFDVCNNCGQAAICTDIRSPIVCWVVLVKGLCSTNAPPVVVMPAQHAVDLNLLPPQAGHRWI